MTTSTAENWGPTAPTIVRARLTARNGNLTALARNSPKLGRRSWSRLTSRNGEGAWRLTTRIISSGVIPLAARAATNEPALVPT